ncbi:efflux RND transporter periplasmic adaptor subunit [Colwellia sp. MB02u-10]|jgi:RND family efflux transporter MFP subunit|uniref:efflux RND transporter periplasmic adaptor subunit n=1 Tax=Colwellia sp. MB02u-10 TaxID=2759828 RepID=UPI0015F3CAC9|nr:efflux RND transporter periplasmic adaptor subunit [Colwellia sp. MB02u-10]MBA6339461.1 efflux RND transporter periplasmic adaptor subunit [Colwellia sp. MB02u-10]
MSFKIKKLLPIIVLSALVFSAYVVTSNPPSAKRGRPSNTPQLSVQVQKLTRSDLAVTIDSYGTIKPRTQSVLLPQVSGKIISISPKFRTGGFFEQGDILLQLDQRDLLAEVKIAQASLFTAKQNFSEEQARVEQAKQDWQRLGNSEQAPELVLRKPQLLAAQASVYSAQASLTKTELAVERSNIVAPYTGRILSKSVDVGQVVSIGTELAEIYAIDYVEIRLPLKNKDLPYMLLPESNRFQKASLEQQPAVTIYSDLAARQSWTGRVVRTEGAFDEASQQLFVVAQIDDPYGENEGNGLPLKIGQYVSAKIDGKTIKNALSIPNRAIYQGSYVYIVDNNVLKRKNITIAWQSEDVAVIATGLVADQLLVLTPLGQVNSGTVVTVSNIDGKAVTRSKKSNKAAKLGANPAADSKNAGKGDKPRKAQSDKAKGVTS